MLERMLFFVEHNLIGAEIFLLAEKSILSFFGVLNKCKAFWNNFHVRPYSDKHIF